MKFLSLPIRQGRLYADGQSTRYLNDKVIKIKWRKNAVNDDVIPAQHDSQQPFHINVTAISEHLPRHCHVVINT